MPVLLIVLFGALVVILLLVLGISGNAADINQAQAVIETARVAQIAAAGQRQATTTILILVVVITALVAAMIALIVFFLRSRSKQDAWAAGPNAMWGRGQQQAQPRQFGPAADPNAELLATLFRAMLQAQTGQPQQPNPARKVYLYPPEEQLYNPFQLEAPAAQSQPPDDRFLT